MRLLHLGQSGVTIAADFVAILIVVVTVYTLPSRLLPETDKDG